MRDNRQHWIALAEGVETKHNKKTNGLVKNKNNKNNTSKPRTNSGASNNDLNDDKPTESEYGIIDTENNSAENEFDEDETGIEADDDDSETELLNQYSTVCYSTGSSRLSTPPPTGEEDSSPNSPAKKASLTETQAQMIAANVDSLNTKPQRQRNSSASSSCKNCECMRVRKTSSLKGANEILRPNGNGKLYSKSTPSVANWGITTASTHHHNSPLSSSNSQSQQHHAQHHHHQHGSTHTHHGHHQHHHHHHPHHNHSHSANGALTTAGAGLNLSNNSSLSESDKIPKIVGKLGNLDTTLHHISNTSNACGSTNAYSAVVANGHLNYLPKNVLSRRHSETNGATKFTTNYCSSNTPTPIPTPIATPTATTLPAPTTKQSLTITPQTPTCDK